MDASAAAEFLFHFVVNFVVLTYVVSLAALAPAVLALAGLLSTL